MDSSVLLGVSRYLVPIPDAVWQRHASGRADLSFMGEAHHRVRNYVVTEMPKAGASLSPERIAEALTLPLDQVIRILDDLEQHMTFLFRGQGRDVTWAYPVTVDPTPHHVTFSTGERIHAA
jgi:hypothetical protein